jgi:hypothetical protein
LGWNSSENHRESYSGINQKRESIFPVFGLGQNFLNRNGIFKAHSELKIVLEVKEFGF